jgi:TldD protein
MAAMAFRFPVDLEDLRKALDTALEGGGDFAEVFLEHGSYTSVNMEEDIIKETAESIGLGLGIRVVRGDQTGFAYTNDFSAGKIRKAARTASAIAKGKRRARPQAFLRAPAPGASLYRASRPAAKADIKEKIDLVAKAYGAARKHDRRITKVKARFQDSLQDVLILNSEGLLVRDSRPLIKLVCVAISEKGGKRESGYHGDGGRVGMEYFGDGTAARRIGTEAAREAVLLLEAGDAPAGEMPIVLAPGHSGVLIHEAVGHLLEADFNRKKTSIFWNKMGKRVGSKLLTIYDDPTIPAFRGSYNVDDEGTPPRKTLLIERGCVRGLLQDRLSARLMGMSPTGHGRRQGYAHTPLPRMANTYIDRGEDDPEEIIRSVGRGFYVASLQGGQVEDTGKFTFSVSLGYLIEGGRLTRPVKQATLVGTNIDILKKIERVGADLAFGLQTGTCSKEGQDVPVTDGCPTMKISAMTVGGRT